MGSYVLVIDDDPDIHVLLGDILGSLDVEGRVALNGEAGLNIAREETPAAVVLDLMMPVMDGYSLLDEFSADDQLNRVPIIVLSAYVDDHESALRQEPGVIGVVSKGAPSASKLSGLISQALGL